MFTVRQGEYLAFIHSDTTKVGVSPSFEDIARHFGTAPPNVNGMIKTLERRGLLSRMPYGEDQRQPATPVVAAPADRGFQRDNRAHPVSAQPMGSRPPRRADVGGRVMPIALVLPAHLDDAGVIPHGLESYDE